MISGVHLLKKLPEVCGLYYLLLAYFSNINLMVASNQLAEAAESWISKLTLKKDSGYPVDSNPNPGSVCLCLLLIYPNYINLALAYHNLQLEKAAFREEFNPETFEDLTLPNYKAMHKVDLVMGASSIT
jgi:hypothetical protein